MEEVRRLPKKSLHRPKSLAQADLYELDWNGQQAVLKDCSARPAWLRRLVGRPLLQREIRSLCQTHGIAGVPRVLARAGPDAFLMERLPGQPVASFSPRQPPPLDSFRRASTLLQALHDHGVSHCDLHWRNVLIDGDGSPYVIDFGAAIATRPGWRGLISRRLFPSAVRYDRFQLARMKAIFFPESLTGEESHTLAHPPWFVRLVLKLGLYKLKSRYNRIVLEGYLKNAP